MTAGGCDYRLKYDFHTHTVYSHGKGSIKDNVSSAKKKGLFGIGISDHGPGHLLYGFDKKNIKKMRGEIEALKEISGVEIYFALEANIFNTGNGIDSEGILLSDFDYIIAGYHYGVRGGFCLSNFIYANSPLKLPGSRKQMIKNTDMAVKAIYENNIKILTHPGDKGPFDLLEIAIACADRGTYLEINDQHDHLSAEGIRLTAKTEVKYAINSDAHTPEKVGSFESGLKRAFEAGLDTERIINIEKCS
jgi:putative hydrolase